MKITFKYFLIALVFLINFICFAQSDTPKIKTTANKIVEFIPFGWKKIYQVSGDLNKDLIVDEALIIENTNPKNLIKNDGMGSNILNVNPRMLLVLFKEKDNTYKLVVKNTKFIPTENDAESTCLTDPLSETNGIEIKKGVLVISYQYFMSCGSWSVTTVDYTFRFQNQKFELIGFDSRDFHRASGEKSQSSLNFSTKKMSITTAGNMFEDEKDKPKTKWKNFKLESLLSLEEMDNNSFEKMQSFD